MKSATAKRPCQNVFEPIRWVGAGVPVFLGHAGEGSVAVPRLFADHAEFEAVHGARDSGSSGFRHCLDSYFAAGGGACRVVNVPALERQVQGSVVAPAFEDGGTVVVPGRVGADLLGMLLEHVVARPSSSLVIKAHDGVTQPADLLDVGEAPPDAGDDPRGRVSWFSPSLAMTTDECPLGGAIGRLCREEFHPDRPERAARLRASDEMPTVGGSFRSLADWRRWEGLRRSLDVGTRWLLFEIQDAFLAARVEREVRAFLYRLFEVGLFEGTDPREAFAVRCEAAIERKPRGVTGRLVLKVRVRMRGGTGVEWKA